MPSTACAPFDPDLVQHTPLNALCIADLIALAVAQGKPAPVVACLSPGRSRNEPRHAEALEASAGGAS